MDLRSRSNIWYDAGLARVRLTSPWHHHRRSLIAAGDPRAAAHPSLLFRLAAWDRGLLTLFKADEELFTGSTVPASPMGLLKESFAAYEDVLPRLYRRLAPLGVQR